VSKLINAEWTEVDIQQILRKIIARMSAKVFLGHPACRNDEWLDLSIAFSIEFFACAFFIRIFPSWLHPVIAPFLPLRWRVARRLKRAQQILAPLMEKHRECVRQRELGEGELADHEEDTLLNWMMDHADEKENRVDRMAIRQTALSLASIHTTSMAISHLLFDLCAHPDWFPVLRDEIEEVRRGVGDFGQRSEHGSKQCLSRMEKMDSALKESMRLNPPILRMAA
jgi:ent-kaurene oxidase